MKKIEYKTPELEIINIELEGIIAGSLASPNAETESTNVKISVSTSSYTMDDYNWQ